MLLSDQHLAATCEGEALDKRRGVSGRGRSRSGADERWQHWGLDSAAAAAGWKEQEVDPRRGPRATRARPLLPALSSALTG